MNREEESEAKANRDTDIGHPVLDLSTPNARPCQEHSLSHSSDLQPSALAYPWREAGGRIGLGYLRASSTKPWAKEKEFPGRSATSRWRQRAKTEWEKLSYRVCETLRVTPCVSRCECNRECGTARACDTGRDTARLRGVGARVTQCEYVCHR